jgi:DinB superfamily
MNKPEIIELLSKNHHSFIEYINGLTNEEYSSSYQQKWTAGQQLEHIVLCVKPLVKVLSMDKLTIEQNFGISTKPSINYNLLISNLKTKLQEGGKAPEKFLPEVVLPEHKNNVSESLMKAIEELSSKIENFSEKELDILMLPHPLLGKITIREMLYVTLFHVEHHHESTIQHLGNN